MIDPVAMYILAIDQKIHRWFVMAPKRTLNRPTNLNLSLQPDQTCEKSKRYRKQTVVRKKMISKLPWLREHLAWIMGLGSIQRLISVFQSTVQGDVIEPG